MWCRVHLLCELLININTKPHANLPKIQTIYLCPMKYQPGDKVLILHSQEEGEVVEIINDKMVLIDVEGVRFPVYMDQIDFPYFKRFSEKKIVDIGPLEINKQEKKSVGWPVYAGGIAVVAGIIVLVADKKKG